MFDGLILGDDKPEVQFGLFLAGLEGHLKEERFIVLFELPYGVSFLGEPLHERSEDDVVAQNLVLVDLFDLFGVEIGHDVKFLGLFMILRFEDGLVQVRKG